jgi:drug/metabolite transporter (DMT)-like permease
MIGKRALRADAMLLAAAAVWGSGFIAQREAMDHMGPFLFNTLRYAVGALVLLPAGHLMLRRLGERWDARVLRDGAILGVVLGVAAGLQQVGMVTTTASRAGFITGLYVLMVPGVAWWFGYRPTRGNLVGVLLAFVGLVLFAAAEGGTGDDASVAGMAVGDLFVLASAGAWAAHVVLIGVMAPQRDPTALVGMQFLVAAACSGVMVLLFEMPGAPEAGSEALTGPPAPTDGAWGGALSVAYAGLMATAAAYTLQFMAQRSAPPTHATVLMSTEAVFAAFFGWLLLGEMLGLTEWFGGGLMLAGALVSQLMGPAPDPEISGTAADPTPPP